MITVTIVFDHRGKTAQGGQGPVEICIKDMNHKRIYISTGIRVHKRNFAGNCIIGQADAPELNERLGILYRRIQEEVNRCIRESRPLIAGDIRRQALRVVEEISERETEVIDFMEEQEGMMRLKEGTLKHYRTLRYRLTEFGRIARWEDVTAESICQFDQWLHQLTTQPTDAQRKSGLLPQPLSDSAVYTYHKCFKAMLNRAVRLERIGRNPYERLRGQFRRGDHENVEFLTVDEMKAIEALHPLAGTTAAVARDLFVFQLHTGMAYADTQAFDIKQFHRDEDGALVAVLRREKTGIPFAVRLSKECERILDAYGRTLPHIANGEYNRALKVIAAAVGIEKPLHSHLARHSFATKKTAQGVDIQMVAKMMGHASIVHTQRYAKVMPEAVFKALRETEDS